MRSFTRLACAATFAVSLAATTAQAADDQQALVDAATATVAQMRASTGFARSGLLARAKAALIVPHALRGAFIVGAQGGQAILIRNQGRTWSNPAFYTVGGVSIGPQIGGEATTSVLLIMTDRALKTLLQPSNATGGVQASLTAARYNANRIAQIGGADVVIWSTSEGAFVGADIDLTGFRQNSDADGAYYGKPVDATAIFASAAANPADAKLRRAF